MLPTTETAIRAIMRADESITQGQADAAIMALKETPTNHEPLDEILTPGETAKLLGRDRHTVAAWEKRGLLVAIRTGKQGQNITGYVGSSVRALLAGNVNANGKAVA